MTIFGTLNPDGKLTIVEVREGYHPKFKSIFKGSVAELAKFCMKG